MKKYWFDNMLIEAETDLDIVTAMRDGSRFCSHESIETFMQGFAKRQFEYDAIFITTSSVELFVSYLMHFKILLSEDEHSDVMREKARKH